MPRRGNKGPQNIFNVFLEYGFQIGAQQKFDTTHLDNQINTRPKGRDGRVKMSVLESGVILDKPYWGLDDMSMNLPYGNLNNILTSNKDGRRFATDIMNRQTMNRRILIFYANSPADRSKVVDALHRQLYQQKAALTQNSHRNPPGTPYYTSGGDNWKTTETMTPVTLSPREYSSSPSHRQYRPMHASSASSQFSPIDDDYTVPARYRSTRSQSVPRTVFVEEEYYPEEKVSPLILVPAEHKRRSFRGHRNQVYSRPASYTRSPHYEEELRETRVVPVKEYVPVRRPTPTPKVERLFIYDPDSTSESEAEYNHRSANRSVSPISTSKFTFEETTPVVLQPVKATFTRNPRTQSPSPRRTEKRNDSDQEDWSVKVRYFEPQANKPPVYQKDGSHFIYVAQKRSPNVLREK